MGKSDSNPVVAVVLAAGMATRMGALKQLLPLGDRRLIERVVDQLTARVGRVVVVVGYRGEEIAAALAGRPVVCVPNPEYAAGMSSSVQCGIRRAGPADAYLICLGDQPVLDGIIEPLLVAANTSSKGILIPTFQGRRGHPLLIRYHYVEQILALGPDQGLNTLTRAHREDTLEVPVGEQGVLEDLDTPADYQRALQRFGEAEHG